MRLSKWAEKFTFGETSMNKIKQRLNSAYFFYRSKLSNNKCKSTNAKCVKGMAVENHTLIPG
jgi:hypothetical protein